MTEDRIPEPVIVASELVKEYDGLVALDHISFEIRTAECFGILGPNGAGKTTAVRMLYGFTPITSGSVRVFGLDVATDARRIKMRIGVCPQEDNLDPDFSTLKNLTNFARYFRMPARKALRRAEEVIDLLGLQDKRGEVITNLSGGLKRRLLVARALINDPDLLILDEPTTGLDPQARHQIWDSIRELKRADKAVLLTTHNMEEATLLCDRLIILDHGRIVEQGVPEPLIEKHIGTDVIEIPSASQEIIADLRARGLEFELHRGRLYVYSRDRDRDYGWIRSEAPGSGLTLRRATLEDVFFKLTGRELRE